MAQHLNQLKQFKYKAIRIKQTESGNWLVLFAAPAVEIDKWVGIPQKKKLGIQETTGFQREENLKRIQEIITFYKNEKNIIQNPLLCALRATQQGSVKFETITIDDHDYIQYGYLTICFEAIEELSLLELLKKLKEDLEKRVPSLSGQIVPDTLIREIKERARAILDLSISEEDLLDSQDENNDLEDESNISTPLIEDSHIIDFWSEVNAYINVLEEIKNTFSGNKFLDYSKDAMISFLRPIVVVDGQHRLKAAIETAKDLIKNLHREKLEEAVLNDENNPEEVLQTLEIEVARKLPISLLMNDDPAEQVFQFVVVNQKATPIKTALLGTIVSTTLSSEELERVADRLEKAGIKLEESKAVSYLVQHPSSPFYYLVERGLTTDKKDLLKWNVLASIIRIFKELKGGQLFHERNDYADKWRRCYLSQSNIIQNSSIEGFDNYFEYWSKIDGVWREVFISFWTEVRNKLADKDNEQAWHFWGNPKQSNIFNKTSLTILAADFFQYLTDKGIAINNKEEISIIVEEWLQGVSKDYFNRDWNLHGIKKDVPGIRKRWSYEWVQYRKDPQRLPKELFIAIL